MLVHIPSPNPRESCTCFRPVSISPGFKEPPAGNTLANTFQKQLRRWLLAQQGETE